MYQLAIFDLDGTILDTLQDLADAVNFAMGKNQMPLHTIDEVRQFVGNGIRKLMERSVPAGTETAVIDKVHADFTGYYQVHCADNTAPYEGIPELLRHLKENGIHTAVVSNKADYAVQSLCEQYFPDLFDAVAGEKEGIQRKPAPDSVNAVLSALHLTKEQAIYIGDSDVDIATANHAGMPCISVAWGFRDIPFLKEHHASRIVETVAELEKMLLQENAV